MASTASTSALDYLLTRPWRDVELPPDVRAVPTMLSPEEQTLLYTLARDYASGEAAIVDAGCFLGGSSAALLAGLRDRPGTWQGPPVTSYDRFLIEDYTIEKYFADQPVEVGGSFRHVYDRNVSSFTAPHEVLEGDIIDLGWSGDPIEILFLDVLKTWKINQSVLREFMPHVIPGRTVLVHQDYGWADMPWIPITVELMRDSLRWVDEMRHGTHVFFVERPIPSNLFELDVEQDLSSDQKLELLSRAVEREEGTTREMLELSKAALLLQHGRGEEAAAVLDALSDSKRPSVQRCLARIRERPAL